jgi:hypothetical protein
MNHESAHDIGFDFFDGFGFGRSFVTVCRHGQSGPASLRRAVVGPALQAPSIVALISHRTEEMIGSLARYFYTFMRDQGVLSCLIMRGAGGLCRR